MSTERLTRNMRRLVAAGTAGAALIVAVAVTANAVTGNSGPSAVTSDAQAGIPGAYASVVGKGVGASTKAGTPLSADLSPSARGKRVTAALGAASGVKAVTVSSDDQKSAISVQLSRNDGSVPQGWYAELAVGAAAQLSATTQTSLDQLISSATAIGPNADGVVTSTELTQFTAEDGTPLLQASAAYRTGTGSLWFAPGQDTRFGALHGTFADAK